MTAAAHVRPRPVAPRRRGPRAGTGVPVIDARADFQRARGAEILARALRRLPPPGGGPRGPPPRGAELRAGARRRLPPRRGAPAPLPALDGVAVLSWTGRDLRVIPLRAIVGTVDATPDFGAAFRPATNRVAQRWQRVALAHRRGHALPPIAGGG